MDFFSCPFETQSVEQTQDLAGEFALFCFNIHQKLKLRIWVELEGEMGAGKTSFAQGFIKAWLKCSSESNHPKNNFNAIGSPTYNLAKVYGTEHPIAHLDLYRLHALDELEQIGYELYFYEMSACLVEWFSQIPQGESLYPKHRYKVHLQIKETPSGFVRLITFEAFPGT